MIEVDKLVPTSYYENSRDFQVLGRLFEMVLNYSKTNADLVLGTIVSDNMNLELVELALYTLGFFKKHNYPNTDLLILAKIFKSIMKIKGTKSAIEYCVYLLLRSQHIEEEFELTINNLVDTTRDVTKDCNELYTIDLRLPTKVKDTILLDDLFDYILPAGYTYNIYYTLLSTTTLKDIYKTTADVTFASGNNSLAIFAGVYSTETDNKSRTYRTVVVNKDSIGSNSITTEDTLDD